MDAGDEGGLRRLAGTVLGALVLALGVVSSAHAAPGAEQLGWGQAVPISTPAPAWFTPALYQRVIAAGPHGVPLSSVDRSPAGKGSPSGGGGGGSGPCLYSSGAAPSGSGVPSTPSGVERPPVGLGPGTWLLSLFCTNVGGRSVPDGFAWCTANFVFQNGSQLGLGTAGHCAAKDALGSPVTAVVTPPPDVCANGGSCEPGLYAIGTFKIAHNNGLGDDFALISLYPQFNSWVRPTMPVFGGPTGAYLGGLAGVPGQTVTAPGATVYTPAFSPAVVGHCGHGVVVGTGGTCRTSAGLFSSSTWYAWYGASAPGDSGSGVEIVGDYAAPGNPVPAAADLTHIIILDATLSRSGHLSEGPDQPGMVAGTQMSKILSIVGSSWTLVNGGAP
ncbi:MAG: hypothetical protein E6G56_13535 [Actinobacteria bacterium]|nr:MAG: hypothetical protein E6G56_13535 [Actinomycetota bacterium]